MGAKAQHKKHGCLIPLEALRRGGRNSGKKQKGQKHQKHGVTEKKFDEWAKKEGYKIYKDGYPDRAIKKDGKVIFVEIKGPKDRLRKSQKKMHGLFKELGLKVIVWQPRQGA